MTRPYTIKTQPIAKRPLPGMTKWVQLACKYSNGSLWNNGTWIVREVRGRPGIMSNHSRGLACDLSYRWQAKLKRGRPDGRKTSLAYVTKLLENADTLGIALCIDYGLVRSWKCDRGTWIGGHYESGDWYHLEIEPRLAHDPKAVKQAFDAVFGVCHKAPHTPI